MTPSILLNPILTPEDTIHLTLRILQVITNQQMISQPPYSILPDDLPLPLGDLTQNPLHPVVTTMPYHQMLYSFLLRLHPCHPQYQEVDQIDHHLTKGPIARLFLLLRRIVLLVQSHPTTFTQLNLPQTLKTHYQFIRGMLGIDQWKHLLSVLMPTLAMLTYHSVWAQVSCILESTLSEMTIWLNSLKSGTMKEPLLKMTPQDPLKELNWKPDDSFIQALAEVKGHMWKVPGGYRMKLPSDLWNEYCNYAPSMSTARIHGFLHGPTSCGSI